MLTLEENNSEPLGYYLERGKREDAAIHDSILAYGDDAAAAEASVALMQQLGLSREEASALLPRKKYWQTKRDLTKFDPDQPRDEEGKWTSGGGDGGGAASTSVPAANQPQKPSEKRPTVAGLRGVSEATVAKVNSAIDAIPAEHREELGVGVTVYRDSKNFPVAEKWRHASGLFAVYADGRKEIKISEAVHSVPTKSVERVMTHELGHAYDSATGQMARHDVTTSLRKMTSRMTPSERQNAKYFLSTPGELFAELYSLTYSPDKSGKYFNMPRDKALNVFKEGVAKIKGMGKPSSFSTEVGASKLVREIIEKAERLLENGIFVADDGTVYAIVNGSAYELDASDTPFAKLPPGDYTEEEADAALEKLSKKYWQAKRETWQDQPRVPAGSPEGGQFGSGGGGGGVGGLGAEPPKPSWRIGVKK